MTKIISCGCGGTPKVETVIYAGDRCYIVKCQSCKTQTHRFPTEESAIHTWNKALCGEKREINNLGIANRIKPNKYYANNGWNFYCPQCGRGVKHKTASCPQCNTKFDWKGV